MYQDEQTQDAGEVAFGNIVNHLAPGFVQTPDDGPVQLPAGATVIRIHANGDIDPEVLKHIQSIFSGANPEQVARPVHGGFPTTPKTEPFNAQERYKALLQHVISLQSSVATLQDHVMRANARVKNIEAEIAVLRKGQVESYIAKLR